MAEMAGGSYGYDASPARGWRRLFTGALGGAAAIALVWGLVSWGHGLLTRDSGQIPFLRAESGPLKIAPEDPGGLKLARTDLAVSRIVGGQPVGAEQGMAPDPEALSDEDQPQPWLAKAPATEQAAAAPDQASPLGNAIDQAVARVLEEQTADGSEAAAEEDEEAPVAATHSASVGSPPPLRPRAPTRAELAAAAAAAAPAPTPVAAAVPAAAPAPVSSTGLIVGDVAVQLGAFNSQTIAESQWRRQMRRNEDLLGGFAHSVTTVESGGRTLYRLRVGPVTDRARAQELCAAMKSRNEACIVVSVR